MKAAMALWRQWRKINQLKAFISGNNRRNVAAYRKINQWRNGAEKKKTSMAAASEKLAAMAANRRIESSKIGQLAKRRRGEIGVSKASSS